MGVCKDCKEKGHRPQEPSKAEMQVGPIETCEICLRRYWTDTGRREDDPLG